MKFGCAIFVCFYNIFLILIVSLSLYVTKSVSRI